MLDNTKFDPEKIELLEVKIIKGQIDTPEEFIIEKGTDQTIENSLQLGFNIEEKLIRAEFTIQLKTDSKGANEHEAEGSFHFVFIYKVANLEELATVNKKNVVDLTASLGSALSSITYSTVRGILLTRLQSTAFQNFILPIINPNKLLHNN
ncbi:MAG: hypothetical protein H7331_09620 [Bacteroidia bacterium]|nr:hypothetical protein [Bacteroidia bacterium]